MEKSIEQHIQPQLFETECIEGLSNQSFLNKSEITEPPLRSVPAQFTRFLMQQMYDVQ